jgi:hypothetical protein
VLAEINNHENRIAAVCQSGHQMLDDGHFASEEIKQRVGTLNDHWTQLKEKALQVSKTIVVLCSVWCMYCVCLCSLMENVFDIIHVLCLLI